MPNYTSKYNLTKPLPTELYDIEVFNENMDKVDAGLNEVKESIENLDVSVTVDGTVTSTSTNPVSGKAVHSYAQPKVTYGTTDLTAGTSALATGAVHLVYE